jgi:heparin binding hemagglutinin HbhA
MAKARFDIPTQLPVAVARPVYAGVGATDRVVEVVRGAVADVQKRALAVQHDVSKTVSGLDYQPQALREQATRAVTTGVDTLGKDAQARRKAAEQRLAALQADAKNLPVFVQKLVDEQVSGAMETYDELVRRGETLVGRIRRQSATQEAGASAQTTTAKAKTTRTQATKTAKKTAKKTTSTAKKTARKSPAKSSAKATATSAKKTASKTAQATTDAASKVGDSAN